MESTKIVNTNLQIEQGADQKTSNHMNVISFSLKNIGKGILIVSIQQWHLFHMQSNEQLLGFFILLVFFAKKPSHSFISKVADPLAPSYLEVQADLVTIFCHQVALSKDLCHLIVMCSGELVEGSDESRKKKVAVQGMHGLHCLMLNTSIFWKR